MRLIPIIAPIRTLAAVLIDTSSKNGRITPQARAAARNADSRLSEYWASSTDQGVDKCSITFAMCWAGEGFEGSEGVRLDCLKTPNFLFAESKRPFFTFFDEGNVCAKAMRDGASDGNGSHCRHSLLS